MKFRTKSDHETKFENAKLKNIFFFADHEISQNFSTFRTSQQNGWDKLFYSKVEDESGGIENLKNKDDVEIEELLQTQRDCLNEEASVEVLLRKLIIWRNIKKLNDLVHTISL